jgi:hypothetical protein
MEIKRRVHESCGESGPLLLIKRPCPLFLESQANQLHRPMQAWCGPSSNLHNNMSLASFEGVLKEGTLEFRNALFCCVKSSCSSYNVCTFVHSCITRKRCTNHLVFPAIRLVEPGCILRGRVEGTSSVSEPVRQNCSEEPMISTVSIQFCLHA